MTDSAGKALSKQLLADATTRLRSAGVDSPRVDAELLLAAVLGVPRARLLTLDDVPAPAAADFAAAVTRRAAREPLQHITGLAPFRHLLLAVGPGVFVPRPETELLVDAVLPRLPPRPLVIDLCSGSGALALAVADEVHGAQVVAVEQSSEAAVWLRRNAQGTSVRVVVGDIRDPAVTQDFAGRADAVLANPPYVALGADVAPEVRADPTAAVFSGPDGFDLIPAVVDRAARLLKPGGVLTMEHDDSQGERVPELLRGDGRWRDITAHFDLAGLPRYAVALRS